MQCTAAHIIIIRLHARDRWPAVPALAGSVFWKAGAGRFTRRDLAPHSCIHVFRAQPMDVVKERLQIQKNVPIGASAASAAASSATAAPAAAAAASAGGHGATKFTGSWNAATTILRQEGIRGWYRGYIAHQCVWGPCECSAGAAQHSSAQRSAGPRMRWSRRQVQLA